MSNTHRVAETAQAYSRMPSSTARARDTAGLRAVLALADKLELTRRQLSALLGCPERTLYHWKKQTDAGGLSTPLPRDTLERLSYLLGIWKALRILFPDDGRAAGWLRRPNAAPGFGDHSALERMLAGQVADLYFVRSYLDGWRS
ncbi:MAG: DUF2384 domain-containing protein [Gammaproteobacteria bacterium]|nr:DUF2384 domain-containing protein [Gammaproteobacteria bacterium]